MKEHLSIACPVCKSVDNWVLRVGETIYEPNGRQFITFECHNYLDAADGWTDQCSGKATVDEYAYRHNLERDNSAYKHKPWRSK